MIKSALCVSSEESRQKKKPRWCLECFMCFKWFSIHLTNCINRWYLQGTSGYNWPSSFPVHFPVSPWIFLLFPLNHSTFNTMFQTVLFSCLGPSYQFLRGQYSQLLLTSSSQPSFVGSFGTHGVDTCISSKAQPSGLPPVTAWLLFSFYVIISSLEQECFFLSFILCDKLLFRSCSNTVHI